MARLRSVCLRGETRLVNAKCRGTIGEVGNGDHNNQSLGKAGRARWLGRRRIVRGVAMNPVDHPNRVVVKVSPRVVAVASTSYRRGASSGKGLPDPSRPLEDLQQSHSGSSQRSSAAQQEII